MRLLLALILLLLPALAQAQITDKTQTSAPFGLNAASASGGACVYPPSSVASCVKLDYQGYQGVAALLKGTWAGTVVGEVSADGGTTWTSVNLVSSAGVSAATVTAAGLYSPSVVAGIQVFQVRVSVYTSGSVDVVLRGTSAQARGTPLGGGSPAPANASYLTSTAEPGLSAEVNLGALTTGVLYHTVSAGVSTPVQIACTSGLLQGGAPPTCTTTPALGTPASGVATNLTGTATALSIGGTAATATALAADPTDCSAGTVALGINAAGTAQCTATPSVTSIQGIVGNVTPAAGTFTTGTVTGHLHSSTTAPAVTNTTANSCGTTAATIVGTDVAGKVTVGATAGTSCTVTFTTTWTNAPACMVNNETTANLARATSTTTTVILAGTFVAGDVLAYMCIGRV